VASFNAGQIAADAMEAFFGDKLSPPPPPPSQRDLKQEERWKPTLTELARYAGRYFSQELETFYVVSLKDSSLVAYHRGLGDIFLIPGTKEGQFQGNQFALQSVQFAASGSILEMLASNGRVRNLRFRIVNKENEF
ncbi:MAG TPA: hypothetical protein VJB38_02660, partial [Bacteroidota bacterium]|nr:hypothetical protein [Bacteroidota bacterium]